MGPKDNFFYKRKNHLYYSGLLPSGLPKKSIFCFGSNSPGDHERATAAAALMHFGAIKGWCIWQTRAKVWHC